eukprot:gene221-225_t
MHANNEIGTIQPLSEISAIIKKFNAENNFRVLFHTDAAQSLGKIPLDVQALSLDLVTIVGHKFGASKGVGALYINPNIRSGCSPMIIGGSQEGGLRAGTESVVLIAGFGEACRIAREEAVETTLHMLALQRRLVQGLQLLQESKGEQVIRFNGPLLPVPVPSSDVDAGQLYKSLRCLPNTVSVSFYGLRANKLLVSVSFYGLRANKLLGYLKDKVACSAGSACHSGCSGQEVMSDVLSAISVPAEYGLGTLRLSVGRHTTVQEVETALGHLRAAADVCA